MFYTSFERSKRQKIVSLGQRTVFCLCLSSSAFWGFKSTIKIFKFFLIFLVCLLFSKTEAIMILSTCFTSARKCGFLQLFFSNLKNFDLRKFHLLFRALSFLYWFGSHVIWLVSRWSNNLIQRMLSAISWAKGFKACAKHLLAYAFFTILMTFLLIFLIWRLLVFFGSTFWNSKFLKQVQKWMRLFDGGNSFSSFFCCEVSNVYNVKNPYNFTKKFIWHGVCELRSPTMCYKKAQ